MKETHIKPAIKTIGAVMALRGIQLSFVSLRSYWWDFRYGSSSSYFLENFYIAAESAVFTLIAVGLVVGGYGLWREKQWSRRFTIVVLSFDFLGRLYGAVYTMTYYWWHPEHKQLYKQMMEQALNGSGGVILDRISMIPSYIQGILALAVVIFLMSKPVRTYFKELVVQDQSTGVSHG